MAADPVLRWGSHGERTVGGLLLIVGGALAIAGSNTFTLWLLALGTVGHAAGWTIMPGPGLRRLAAALVSTLAVWLLISGNPRFVGVAVVPYLFWLLVTRAPALAGLTALLPASAAVAVALLAGPEFFADRGMLPALGMVAAATALAALVTWGIRRALSRRNPSGTP